MSPRMRPSSTRRSTPSSATVVPKALRRPRASMQLMTSSLLSRLRGGAAGVQQLLRRQAEALDRRVDPGPLFREELLAFALQEQIARAGVDEHAAPSPPLHESIVDELLVAFQYRERIHPVLGGDRAHRRQRIAFVEDAVEDHRDDAIAKLPVDGLAVVPLSGHLIWCSSQL